MRKIISVSVVLMGLCGCSFLDMNAAPPQPGPEPAITSIIDETGYPVESQTIQPTIMPEARNKAESTATPTPIVLSVEDGEVLTFLEVLSDDINVMGTLFANLNQLYSNGEDISLVLEEIKNLSKSFRDMTIPESAMVISSQIESLAETMITFCDECLTHIQNNRRYNISELVVPVSEAIDELLLTMEAIEW